MSKEHKKDNMLDGKRRRSCLALLKGASRSEDELESLREMFNFFDQDECGGINSKDLSAMFELIGFHPTSKEINDIMKGCDTHDILDFDRFVSLVNSTFQPVSEMKKEDLTSMLKVFDAEGSGFISKRTLQKVMKQFMQHVSDEQLTEMMDEIFVERDDQVDYNEFILYLFPK